METNQREMNKMFVYGTLMTGFGNHQYLRDSRFLGKAFTMNKYHMTTAYIPYVAEEEHENSNYILGEVYEVDDQTLRSIDMLEGHPSFYERKEVDVRLDDGSTMKCWIYFNSDGGHTEVKSGNYYLWRYSNVSQIGMVDYGEDRRNNRERY